MKLNQMKRIVALMEELDMRRKTIESDKGMSPIIQRALIGSCVELQNNLVEQWERNHGLRVEV